MGPFRVVETDNFGRDYPAESFVTPCLSREGAEKIADILNAEAGPHADRFFKVEHEDYKLAPGFEP
jgi:hypothetical protein